MGWMAGGGSPGTTLRAAADWFNFQGEKRGTCPHLPLIAAPAIAPLSMMVTATPRPVGPESDDSASAASSPTGPQPITQTRTGGAGAVFPALASIRTLGEGEVRGGCAIYSGVALVHDGGHVQATLIPLYRSVCSP